MENELVLSTLGHTWLLDLDGTIVKHNGYKTDGYDTFLDGAEEFLNRIPESDTVVFLTSRTEEYRSITEQFLKEHGVRYHHIIFGLPYGERILVNDNKSSGLCTARCLNLERDSAPQCKLKFDSSL
jgi:hypothetical protein